MDNQATSKLSPFKQPTPEQAALILEAKAFIKKHLHDTKPAVFVITGDAGTGKSVVLSQLFYDLQMASASHSNALTGTQNYFLVNHPELLKVYRNIAGQLPGMYKKSFQRPTSLINSLHKENARFDVGVVDEAHLLLSQPDHYNNFYDQNQLLSLLKLAHVLIIVFDEHQVLRLKTYWTTVRLKSLLKPFTQKWVRLDRQFRMQASDNLVNWIDHFTDEGQILPMSDDFRSNYDFRIFDDAEKMRQAIVQKNSKVGLSRVVATTGYPSTLDGGKHYIKEGRFRLPWDQYNYTATPWAEIPETINEVGSIYTCQGFDLNYVGIILGPPVKLANNGNRIKIDTAKITDSESFKQRKDMQDSNEVACAKVQLVLNAINVLMKRGVMGLYLFAHDERLSQLLMAQYRHIEKPS